MKVNLPLLLFLTILAAGCAANNEETSTDNQNAAEESEENQDQNEDSMNNREIIADNLETPWSIEMSEDMIYLTEREGSIVQIEGENVERQEVALEEKISTASEAGLLGFTLTPDFEESNQAYAYYTYEGSEGQYNRVITLQFDGDVWQEDELLLDEIPSGNYHHGGRIEIGPDDMLYVTAGDASESDIAQDEDSLGGKILRMELDGSVPDDNPFEDSYVYSLGHRNPQGLTWANDDTMYASEHGDNANDEINLIEPGENYGWPVIEGDEEQEGMVSPLFTSGSDETWAPSGMDYVDERLYVAALRGTAILEFDLETEEFNEVISDVGRVRDIYIEDDDLYFISNNGDGRGDPESDDDRLYRVPLSELD